MQLRPMTDSRSSTTTSRRPARSARSAPGRGGRQRGPRSLDGLILERTPDSWWSVAMDDPVSDLALPGRTRNAVRLAGYIRRVADLRDLDLERFAREGGVGRNITAGMRLLRDVLRYRCRVASPDRTAFEAMLPRNRIPPAWQTMFLGDRLETLSVGKRAGDALADAGAAAVSDVLDLTLVELLARSGAGSTTEVELSDLFRALHHRFADVARPRRQSLDGCFEDICPRPSKPGGIDPTHAVLRRFLGLHPGSRPLPTWPSPEAIATDLGIRRARAEEIVSKARGTWRHPSRHRIRAELEHVLVNRGGEASAVELASELLRRLGSAASDEVRQRRAAAVVRAGVEGEMSRGPRAARFHTDRRLGKIWVMSTDDGLH